MEIKLYSNNSQETEAIGAHLGSYLNAKDTVLLVGDLSAGKTTLTKGIGKALGVTRIINSPTFTIVKEYQGDKCKLYHLDLYRLDGLNDDFDLEEYFDADGVCVIEWPYQASELIPSEYLLVDIKRTGNETREITLKAYGSHYEEILKEVRI